MTYSVIFAGWFVIIIAYLALFVYLISYLRRVHTRIWVTLERPAVPNITAHAENPWPFLQSMFLTFLFILSDRYRALGDARLGSII